MPNSVTSGVWERNERKRLSGCRVVMERKRSQLVKNHGFNPCEILDEKNVSLSLKTLSRAATVLGKRIRLELVNV